MLAWDTLHVLYCMNLAFLTEFFEKTLPPSSVNVALDQWETELIVATPDSVKPPYYGE